MKSLLLAVALIGAAGISNARSVYDDIIDEAVEAGRSTESYLSGEALYRESHDRRFFVAFITGVADTGVLMPEGARGRYCAPPTATNGQVADVVLKYLEANPARRHLGAAYLVRQSLHEAWPCPIEAAPPAAPPKPQPRRPST